MNSFAETVFRRHYRTIYGFILRRVRDRDDADDLAQQVFADAVSTLAVARPSGETALAWLYTVARRRLADDVRRRGRNEVLIARLSTIPAGEAPDEYGTRLGALLSDAIAALPPESARVVIAHLLRGQSFAHLAQETGATEAALKMRYVREIRAALEKKGFEP